MWLSPLKNIDVCCALQLDHGMNFSIVKHQNESSEGYLTVSVLKGRFRKEKQCISVLKLNGWHIEKSRRRWRGRKRRRWRRRRSRRKRTGATSGSCSFSWGHVQHSTVLKVFKSVSPRVGHHPHVRVLLAMTRWLWHFCSQKTFFFLNISHWKGTTFSKTLGSKQKRRVLLLFLLFIFF